MENCNYISKNEIINIINYSLLYVILNFAIKIRQIFFISKQSIHIIVILINQKTFKTKNFWKCTWISNIHKFEKNYRSNRMSLFSIIVNFNSSSE